MKKKFCRNCRSRIDKVCRHPESKWRDKWMCRTSPGCEHYAPEAKGGRHERSSTGRTAQQHGEGRS